MNQDVKLKEAIDIVENAGGFVMFPESDQDELKIRTETLKAENKVIEDEEAIEAENKREYEERKQNAFEEFDKLLGSKNFSVSAVDDICYENGIDLDDIEEYIFNHF